MNETIKGVVMQAIYQNKATGSLFATGEEVKVCLDNIWYTMIGYGRFPLKDEDPITARIPADFLDHFTFVRNMSQDDLEAMIGEIMS